MTIARLRLASRGKQLVSPVGPHPSSAAGFAIGVRDSLYGKPFDAAPAMSVAATNTGCRTGQEAR